MVPGRDGRHKEWPSEEAGDADGRSGLLGEQEALHAWMSQRQPSRYGSFWWRWFMLLLVIGAVVGGGVAWFERTGERLAPPVVSLWRSDIGEVMELDLEEYLRGVVAAEMPGLFHMEALKAQAVAARTYTLRALLNGRRSLEHQRAVLSAEAAAGQAWLPAQALRERWGNEGFTRYWDRIGQAVAATRGEVLVYEGKLIEALYHSTSGGHTENAHEYFRNFQPYLVGVPDPFSQHSPHFQRRVATPRQLALQALGATEAIRSVEIVERTETGRVKTVRLAGLELSGREVRERLGLPSSWFEVEENGEDIVWLVRGNGHGVGLSQYGADGMGRQGYGYREILQHYYQGARITTLY